MLAWAEPGHECIRAMLTAFADVNSAHHARRVHWSHLREMWCRAHMPWAWTAGEGSVAAACTQGSAIPSAAWSASDLRRRTSHASCCAALARSNASGPEHRKTAFPQSAVRQGSTGQALTTADRTGSAQACRFHRHLWEATPHRSLLCAVMSRSAWKAHLCKPGTEHFSPAG